MQIEHTVSEVLHIAADRIQAQGWTRGTQGWVASGELCVEGALAAALGVDGYALANNREQGYPEFQACPAYKAVQSYLGLTENSPYRGDLWAWNDDQFNGHRVVEVLRAAAEVEAAKEAELAAGVVA